MKLRNEVGIVLSEEKLGQLHEKINLLISNKDIWIKKIKNVREQTIFNIGNSGEKAAEWFLSELRHHYEQYEN